MVGNDGEMNGSCAFASILLGGASKRNVRRLSTLPHAIVAVFLPLIIFSIVLGLMATILLPIPLVGAFAGLGGFMYAAMHVGPLLFGAAVVG